MRGRRPARPSSSTGTRSASCSSRKRKASSSGTSGSIVQCAGSAICPIAVSPGFRPAATTSRTSVLRVTTPTKRPVLADVDRAHVGLRRGAAPASCAEAVASSVCGSGIIASRTLSVTGRCPAPERAGDLADSGDERRAAQREPALLSERPDALESVAELLGQLRPDFSAIPEEPAEVLHPLEVGDGDAACVGEHVRQDRDAALGEDRVRLERGGPVRALGDHPRLDPVGVLGGDLILARGQDEDVAGKLEQLLVRDPVALGPVRKRAVLLGEAPQRLDVEPACVVDTAREIGDSEHGRALGIELGRGDPAHVAEALDDAALFGQVPAEPLRRRARSPSPHRRPSPRGGKGSRRARSACR